MHHSKKEPEVSELTLVRIKAQKALQMRTHVALEHSVIKHCASESPAIIMGYLFFTEVNIIGVFIHLVFLHSFPKNTLIP